MVTLRRAGVLGLSVGTTSVHAVLVERDAIAWAGRADYSQLAELSEVVARLAGESGHAVRRARAVFEREAVQLRSLVPAPPLGSAAVRRYVALEAPRLFRANGAPLVTDACLIPVGGTQRALWAAAVPEPLVRAVLEGCLEAGLAIDSVGPAADVLPWALVSPMRDAVIAYPNGGTSEVLSLGPAGTWRSRLVPGTGEPPAWATPLLPLGQEAGHFAPAYAAALMPSRLQLLPGDTRADRDRFTRRRSIRIAALGMALLLLAGVVHVGRLASSLRSSTAYLDANAAVLDSALALRRELATGRATLETIAEADRERSRWLLLLADLTTVLGDSVFLVALRVGPDRVIRLSGYAPSATRVVASLERVSSLREPKLEGAITRESIPGRGELERFAVAVVVERRP